MAFLGFMKRIFHQQYFLPVLISIGVHIAVLCFFIVGRLSSSDNSVKKPLAINSYLYQLPKTSAIKKLEKVVGQEPLDPREKQVVASKQKSEIESVAKEKPNELIAEQKTDELTLSNQQNSALKSVEDSANNGIRQPSFSAYRSLDSLSMTIDEKIKSEEFDEITAHKSISTMHQDPESVSHSITELNADDPEVQARDLARRTMHYGNTTIYKDDNGICTQITDLTSVGLMGMTSLDTYKCGESKMEKAFRLHMKALFENRGHSNTSGAK